MSETKIEWTERTWNPIVGCTVHSPGCKNCYAMRMAARLEAMAVKPDGDGNPALNHYVGTTESSRRGAVWTGKIGIAPDEAFTAPLRRKKPTDYFVNSMSDLFHKDVPIEIIARTFSIMADCPQHTFKVLTKRSDRMRQILYGPKDHQLWSPKLWHRSVLPNVWLGVSVEDQTRADERREDFRNTPAAVKFVSYEPALGYVNWAGWAFVDQIIGGGESGPKARPSHPQWFRDTRDWCAAEGVHYFHKQNGEYASVSEVEGPGEHYQFPDGATVRKVGKKRAGRLLDGVEHNGFPGQVEGEGRK